ncbi:tRNA nucleotidyltransferase [Microbacterium phage PauloDiaboli]|nr:tRNA nucleotidyltransferase [Microbacterium phage PauloDiaboli]QWY84079.1 tRNA nucleotidyltransferase [Microbacterium phage A3Wally]
MTYIKTYLVGGAVRDKLLGLPVKDFDYTVVVGNAKTVPEAWDAMRAHLKAEGFTIFLETPEYFTIRAKFPKDHENAKITADFVLARQEGPYSDGRHPDWVKPGTLADDLRRRDFSVNAMAEDGDGNIIDYYQGRRRLEHRVLEAVGDPRDRMTEDPLRALRAVRFAVTKGFKIEHDLAYAMRTMKVLDSLRNDISVDRIRDELFRCFEYDTVKTIAFLYDQFPMYLDIMAERGIWLKPTMEKRKSA